MSEQLIVLPYTAVSFSVLARFIFMYLLYSKQSTNIYSLTFCGLSIVSSSIWIPYGILQNDIPIIVRSGVEILLLSISGVYILRNRCVLSNQNSPAVHRPCETNRILSVSRADQRSTRPPPQDPAAL